MNEKSIVMCPRNVLHPKKENSFPAQSYHYTTTTFITFIVLRHNLFDALLQYVNFVREDVDK